jgi:deoxyribodipyrimidine photo-lyase
MPEGIQQQCGVMVGRDYPVPIVEHDLARRRTLARYEVVKQKPASDI